MKSSGSNFDMPYCREQLASTIVVTSSNTCQGLWYVSVFTLCSFIVWSYIRVTWDQSGAIAKLESSKGPKFCSKLTKLEIGIKILNFHSRFQRTGKVCLKGALLGKNVKSRVLCLHHQPRLKLKVPKKDDVSLKERVLNKHICVLIPR